MQGRKDAFARFWQNSFTGKSGYTPVYGEDGKLISLSENIIAGHLKGLELIDIYCYLEPSKTIGRYGEIVAGFLASGCFAM